MFDLNKMYEIIDLETRKKDETKSSYYFEVKGKQWMLITINKGKIGGEHYHKGESELKNPEIAVIIKGKAEIYLKNIITNEEKTIIVEAPKILKIQPNVYHEIKALEDFTFIEPYDETSLKDVVKN
jgi:quercetin dioxygenase-like cupin family protein